MSKNVKYTGTADFQEFGKADFAKADVDHGKVVFAQGVPQELPDEVVDALVSKEGIFGNHSFEEVESDEEADADAEKAAAEAKAAKDAAAGTPGPEQSAGDGNTGKGTSTASAVTSRSPR